MDKREIEVEVKKAVQRHLNTLNEKMADLENRAESVRRGMWVDFEHAMFIVTLNDKGAAYDHTVEVTRVTIRGLEETIKAAEEEHMRLYGNLRRDGYVSYSVTIPIGREDIPLPVELWQGFTVQTMASLEKARKM